MFKNVHITCKLTKFFWIESKTQTDYLYCISFRNKKMTNSKSSIQTHHVGSQAVTCKNGLDYSENKKDIRTQGI